MAITLVGTSSSGSINTLGAGTFSHITGTLTNGALVAMVSARDTASTADYPVTGVTYAGSALTKIRHDAWEVTTVNERTELWYILNPTVGTNNVIVSFTGVVDRFVLGAMTFSGVDQVSPIDANAGSAGLGGTLGTEFSTVNITTLNKNDWLIGAYFNTTGPGTRPATPGAGQTSVYVTDTNNDSNAASYKSNVAYGTNDMSYSWSGTTNGNQGWAFSVAALNPFGIQFDAASNSGYLSAAAEPDGIYSWSHTCSGASRYLEVDISMLSVAGSSVTSITYNGVALSLIGFKASAAGAVRVEMWGLVAPSLGANTITVTLSTALDSIGKAVSFTGVHQDSPTEAFNSASATNVGAADATVDVTTVTNNTMVIDAVASDDTAMTVGAGQTQRNNATGALGSGADSTEEKATAGVVTMNWTDVAGLATWSICAVALRPDESVSLSVRRAFRNLLGVGI